MKPAFFRFPGGNNLVRGYLPISSCLHLHTHELLLPVGGAYYA